MPSAIKLNQPDPERDLLDRLFGAPDEMDLGDPVNDGGGVRAGGESLVEHVGVFMFCSRKSASVETAQVSGTFTMRF